MNEKMCIKNDKLKFPTRYFSFTLLLALLLSACTFDYGADDRMGATRPDIVMENIEYVRVRDGFMLARFHAEHAEQWEERQIMELREFTFEQMEDQGQTVNVEGNARAAEVHLESGDISLSGGVNVRIESEDIIINTLELNWNDSARTLTGNTEEEVEVLRSDGTNFIGVGFSADIRRRTWAFSGEAAGSFVEEDEEENGEANGFDEAGEE